MSTKQTAYVSALRAELTSQKIKCDVDVVCSIAASVFSKMPPSSSRGGNGPVVRTPLEEFRQDPARVAIRIAAQAAPGHSKLPDLQRRQAVTNAWKAAWARLTPAEQAPYIRASEATKIARFQYEQSDEYKATAHTKGKTVFPASHPKPVLQAFMSFSAEHNKEYPNKQALAAAWKDPSTGYKLHYEAVWKVENDAYKAAVLAWNKTPEGKAFTVQQMKTKAAAAANAAATGKPKKPMNACQLYYAFIKKQIVAGQIPTMDKTEILAAWAELQKVALAPDCDKATKEHYDWFIGKAAKALAAYKIELKKWTETAPAIKAEAVEDDDVPPPKSSNPFGDESESDDDAPETVEGDENDTMFDDE